MQVVALHREVGKRASFTPVTCGDCKKIRALVGVARGSHLLLPDSQLPALHGAVVHVTRSGRKSGA